MRARARAVSLLVILILAGRPAESARGERAFAVGRRLSAAIDRLRAEGLKVIYSSDVVEPGMRVLAEPVATTPRGILDDLVQPHGLVAQEGPGATLILVRLPAGAEPAGGMGGVAGRIVDRATGEPAGGATVSVPKAGVALAAAPDGRFLVPRIAAGAWTLVIASADGRLRQSASLVVKPHGMTRVVIDLASPSTRIEHVVITPSRYTIAASRPEGAISLGEEELDRRGAIGDDVLRAAATIPGAAAADKSARSSLRGGESGETLVLLDHLEIDQPFHLKEFLAYSSIVNSRAIDKVDILTGGFPVEYGDRMSGVMQLASSTPERKTATSLGTGMPDSWVTSSGMTASGQRRWLAAVRAWYPGTLREGVDPGGEDLNPTYDDLFGKVEHRFGNGQTLSGHVLSARDLVDFQDAATPDHARARYGTDYVWLNLASPWTARLYSLSQLSAGRSDGNRSGSSADAGQESIRVADARTSGFVGAKQDWLFHAGDRALLKWGFDARLVRADYDYALHSVIDDPIVVPAGTSRVVDRRVRVAPSGTRFGTYAAARLKPLAPLTLEMGLRWDRQSYTSDGHLDPRLNLVWSPTGRVAVRASWGLFHQSERIDELQIEDGARRYFPAQEAQHRIVSVERAFGNGVRFVADAYWKTMSHLRPRFENLFNPITLFPEGESDRVRIAPRRADARGLDLYLSGNAARDFTWWAGYALSRATDRIDGRAEPRSWDQRQALNVGAGYRFADGWEADLTGSYHSGWPTTEVEAQQVLDPNGVATIQAAPGARNDQRFPPYHRLDLKLVRRVSLPDSTLAFTLGVMNVYNRRNVCCVDEFRFRPRPGGAVEVERLEEFWQARLVTFRVAWEF